MEKEEKKYYEKIIELNSQLLKLKDEIDSLKPKATKELYEMGYSMDRIALMIGYGKINVLNTLHKQKIKIRLNRNKEVRNR